MGAAKEKIFIGIIAFSVIYGGIFVRLTDNRYNKTEEASSTFINGAFLGKGMSVKGLPCGSTIATEGSMLYFFVNDSSTIQFDFKSRIKSVGFDSTCIMITVSDSVYRIPFNAGKTLPSSMATEIPPIPIASVSLFSQSAPPAEK